MLLNGKYLFAVLDRSKLRYWADYAKWATEGLFEYIRKNEYPQCVSRLHCNYFCAGLDDCIRMFEEDWGEEDEEDRQKVHLFEVEVAQDAPEMRDIFFFDAAYDAIHEKQDIDAAIGFARTYFAGERSEKPNLELLSAAEAIARKDITHLLRERE